MIITGRYWVYRYWSHAGDLLYVGHTENPDRRHYQHQLSTPWFAEVGQYEVLPPVYLNRQLARDAEAFFIRYGNPRYNRAHNFKGSWGITWSNQKDLDKYRAKAKALASKRVAV